MVEKRRILCFILLAFGLAWLSGLVLFMRGMRYGDALSAFWLSACMLAPAIASILARAFTGEGFKGMGWAPGFKQGGWKWYIAAFFAPTLCMLVGGAVYFLLFPSQFDPSGRLLLDALRQAGVPEGMLPAVVAMHLVQGVLLGPILNIPFTLGEELGWRAYLLPKLRGLYGPRPAILLSGVIWGLWHAPMIALGHNYDTGYWGWPVGGILAMVVFCMAMGAFLSLITFRTKSVWPAAIAHSGINAIASLPVFFTKGGASPFVGPAMIGLVGGIAVLALGVWSFLHVSKRAQQDAAQGNV